MNSEVTEVTLSPSQLDAAPEIILDAKDGVEVEDCVSPVRSQRSPKQGGSRQKKSPTKLYVGNVSNHVRIRDLRSMFEKFGHVTDVDIVGSFAFVSMSNGKDAEEAILSLHGTNLEGKKLIVEKKMHERKRSGSRRNRDNISHKGRGVTIYVNGVRDSDEDKLKTIFENFGEVLSVSKPRSKPGIAFVEMAYFFEAKKAIEAVNKKTARGVAVSMFANFGAGNVIRGQNLNTLLGCGETTKLYVGNLDKEVDSKQLGILFEKYGPVFEAVVIKDKGYAFVHMLSRDTAEDAIRDLNRKPMNGKSLRVSLSVKSGGTQPGVGSTRSFNDRLPRQRDSRQPMGGSQSMAPRRPPLTAMQSGSGIGSGPGMQQMYKNALFDLQQQIQSQFISRLGDHNMGQHNGQGHLDRHSHWGHGRFDRGQHRGQGRFDRHHYGAQERLDRGQHGGQDHFDRGQHGGQDHFDRGQHGGQDHFNRGQNGGQEATCTRQQWGLKDQQSELMGPPSSGFFEPDGFQCPSFRNSKFLNPSSPRKRDSHSQLSLSSFTGAAGSTRSCGSMSMAPRNNLSLGFFNGLEEQRRSAFDAFWRENKYMSDSQSSFKRGRSPIRPSWGSRRLSPSPKRHNNKGVSFDMPTEKMNDGRKPFFQINDHQTPKTTSHFVASRMSAMSLPPRSLISIYQ